jgi:riboflavin transporter FmnP
MTMRDLHRHLSRVPELTRAYRLGNAATVEMIMSRAGALLLQAGSSEMGVKGNFAFTIAFMNSYEYIKKMFKDTKEGE